MRKPMPPTAGRRRRIAGTREGVRVIFHNYASFTTLHGLPNAHSASEWVGRIFWSLVFLSCLTAFSTQLYILINKFFHYDKNIELDIKFQSMIFPAVTFCSLNPFEESKAMRIPQIRSLKNAYDTAMHNIRSEDEKSTTPTPPGGRNQNRPKRTAKGSEVVLGTCLHQKREKYYIPLSETQHFSKQQLKVMVETKCLCVNDKWDFLSYCAPKQYWVDMACHIHKCKPTSNYCGSYTRSLNPKIQRVNPLMFTSCKCNLLADGCYKTPEPLATPTPSALPSATHPPTNTQDGEADRVFDYKFLFKNVTDEMALQSSAKGTLVFIGGELSEEQRINISYVKNTLIQMCSFNGEQCDIDRDFQLRTDPFYGNCFTFNWNSSRLLSSTRAGAIYGLRVMMQAPLEDYLFTTDSAGIRLAIHDPNQEPFPEVFGQSAPNGFASAFGIKLDVMEHLPEPYGDCSNEKSGTYIYKEDYSIEGCYRSCYQSKVLAMCGCGDPRFPVPQGRESCPADNEYLRNCLNRAANLLGDFNRVTGCSCPKPCKQKVFTAIYSGSIWPAKDTELSTCNSSSHESCLVDFKQNSAVIEVYYERLNFQMLREIPSYEVSALISDIGGICGLWLGASVITCLEFLALIGQIFVFICSNRLGYKPQVPLSPEPSQIRPLAKADDEKSKSQVSLKDL